MALPFVSRLPRKCGDLNISQPYGPPRPVTGIVLHFSHTTNDNISTAQVDAHTGTYVELAERLGHSVPTLNKTVTDKPYRN
jgi:hypothetical protein